MPFFCQVPGSPIFIMKLASDVRHLEVQVLADQYGNTISLYGRFVCMVDDMFVNMDVCLSTWMYVWMYVRLHGCIYGCMSVCMDVCMDVCVYVWVYV